MSQGSPMEATGFAGGRRSLAITTLSFHGHCKKPRPS